MVDENPSTSAGREMLDMLGPAYANSLPFWKAIVWSTVLQGLILGGVCLGFFNCFTAIKEATWLQGDYQAALDYVPSSSSDSSSVLDPLRLGHGEWWYVGMMAVNGCAVGIIKVLWSTTLPAHVFPEKIPGFLKHLKELKTDDTWYQALAVLVASAVSIGLGACVGPEVALGATGTALGTFLACRWRMGSVKARRYDQKYHDTTICTANVDHQEVNDDADEYSQYGQMAKLLSNMLPDFSSRKDQQLCALDGMSAAFGALFPGQLLGPLLLVELGNHWGPGGTLSLNETLARIGLAATFSYAMFTGLEDRTLLQEVQLPVAAYDLLPTIDIKYLAYAAILGIIAGVVGLVGLLCIGILGQIGDCVNDTLNAVGAQKFGLTDHVLGKLLTPAIGGVLVGLLQVAAPLNLSDGSDQLKTVFICREALGAGTLIASGLLKIVCLGISIGFGMVGGPVFPLIFAGACMGGAVNVLLPGIPLLIAFPSCLVALPAAFMPSLFFFTFLSSLVVVLGGPATSAVFVACLSSSCTVSGTGLLQWLIRRKMSTEDTAAAAASTDEQGALALGTGNVLLQSTTKTKEQTDALLREPAEMTVVAV